MTSPYSSSSPSIAESWKSPTAAGAESGTGTGMTSAMNLALLREAALLLFCISREGLKPLRTLAAPPRALVDSEELDDASNRSARNGAFCCDCPEDDERPWLSKIPGREGGVAGLSSSPSSATNALSPCLVPEIT